MSDEPAQAALASCLLAVEGTYLPVMDGPRLQRPDASSEVVRRNNAIGRAGAEVVILAGVKSSSAEAIAAKIPKRMLMVFDGENSQQEIRDRLGNKPPIKWGSDHLAVGLLKALRERTTVEFGAGASPVETVPTRSGHMVVCEAGEDLSEVIAANYAFALGAGLKVIPAVPKDRAKEIMDRLYGLYESGDPQAEFQAVRRDLRELCGEIAVPADGSISFITRSLPFGIAFPDFPSTHLFTYPDLGLSVINGLAAEQPGSPGVNVAVLVDPQTTSNARGEPAGEILPAVKALAKRGTFVRVHSGRGAEVTEVSDTVERYPYDLLVFSTHCGDSNGYRWTYEFVDSEGISRTMVVDIALGIGRTDEEDRLAVTEFMHFHSLDGVDWNGPDKANLYVGTAMNDFIDLKKGQNFKPTKKEDIGRVLGSAVMQMNDSSYLPMHHSLADKETPIIINNACVSWHELAGRFMFANARAYVGTLVEVNSLVAERVVPLIFDKYYGKPLAAAVWAAQREVFGNTDRQPYVTTGVYPQRLRAKRQDTPSIIRSKLEAAAIEWRGMADEQRAKGEAELSERSGRVLAYYERQLAEFGSRTRSTIPFS